MVRHGVAWHDGPPLFSPGATVLSRYLGSLGSDFRGYESHYSGKQVRDRAAGHDGTKKDPSPSIVTRAENLSGIGVSWASET